MSKRVTVELFYDIVSPYSALGWTLLQRYKSVWPMTLTLRPFFLGGVMKAVNNTVRALPSSSPSLPYVPLPM